MENGIEGINQTLQDIIWHGLSKHAIEAIIIGYEPESHKPQKDQYTLGVLHTYEGLFGFQNLKDPWRFISKTETTTETTKDAYEQYCEAKANESRNLSQDELINLLPIGISQMIRDKYEMYKPQAFNGYAVGYCAALRDIFGWDATSGKN